VRIALAALAMLGAACAQAGAQQQPPQQPPCSGPEFGQMDFWVGTWDVRWDAWPSSGIPAGRGTNTITRQLGACVIQEDFDGGPSVGGLLGRSVSLYHAQTRLWRQTWVDNQGGYFALTGGPEGDRFILTTTRLSEAVPQTRMVYQDITPTSLTWHWQRSNDGGVTWTDTWVIYYVRRGVP